MLKVSDEFKKIVGLTEDYKPNFLEWDYRVYIDKKEYKSDVIKSLNISGQLQNNFTIGSSLSLSLELELLISEETYFPNSANIKVYATLKNEAKIKGIVRPLNEDVLLGTFIATDIDRQTIGRIKIQACDIMGHIDYLSSEMTFTDLINPATKPARAFQPEDFPIEARDLAIAIANRFNIQIEENIPEGNKLVTNFVVLYGLTYRQALEYLAGIYGGYVKVTREGRLSFFRFTNTGIKLTKENYYNMTKGQYEFRAEAIQCTISKVEEHTNNETSEKESFTNTSTLRIGDEKAKLNHTVVFTNPYISEAKMDDLLIMYRDVSYYPITMNAIGTCILEPGDIVTIFDHYDREYKLYIQSYKITCAAGIKETFESHYDYNGGSFSNSITGSIKQINEKLSSTSSFIENNFETITSGITRKEFTTTVNDLTDDIELSNNSMNKWLLEYYGLSENDKYDIESILTRTPFRKELVPDSSSMVASHLYGDEEYPRVLCRFYTAVYVQEDVEDVSFTHSDSTIIYINGNKIESGNIKFSAGWNIIELYKGMEPQNTTDYIEVYFHLEVPRSKENGMTLYTHPTSMLMNEYANEGENLNYITIMNPHSMNIDYTRIVTAERSITTDAIVDRLSQTEVFVESTSYESDKEEINKTITQSISEVRQEIDNVTTRVESRLDIIDGLTSEHTEKLGQLEVTDENISAEVKRVDEKVDGNDKIYTEKLGQLEVTTDNISAEVKRVDEKVDGNDTTYLEKFSKIEETADGINAYIAEVEGEMHNMDSEYSKKFAEIEADVEEVEFKFGTSSGNNYFTNSSFMTDSPQSNYVYSSSKAGTFKYVKGSYSDNSIASTLKIETNNIELDNEPLTTFTVMDSASENKNSNVRSIKCDGFFSLSQIVTERDFYPNIDYRADNQLYMSVNTKLLEKSGFENVYLNFFVIAETDKKQFIYNSHEAFSQYEDPATMNYYALGDCMCDYSKVITDVTTDFNVFPSNKSNSVDEESSFIYKNTRALSDDWEKQSVFINLNGIKTIQDYTRENITKLTFGFNAFTKDVAIEGEPKKLSIGLNEPFLCFTKGNIDHPYSQNPNEIFSGSTKINYDGIEVSKNTSPIKTKIRNTGMSIYNNDTQLAYFESDAYVPVLKVDEVISDGVATKDHTYSSTVQEIKVGIPPVAEEGQEQIVCDYSSLRSAFEALPDYIDTDYLVIRVYGNLIIDRYTSLKNKKCGVIEILLEPESNIAGYPLLISNIDGIVRIRSSQVKGDINMTFTEDFGNIGYCLFCHNIKHLEISAINFSREKIEDNNGKLENFDFPFNYIYQYKYSTGKVGVLTELVEILKYSGIFIGYCNLVDINRCNFGAIGTTTNQYGETGDVSLTYGVVGDHSDCYVFNNKGNLKYYYINRDKCWYRLPVKGNLTDSEWGQVYEPSTSVKPNGIGNNISGNTGNKIEQNTSSNTSGNGSGKQESSDDYNPPYVPSNKDESVLPNTYYSAFRTDNDYSFRNMSGRDKMFVGPLSYKRTPFSYYREKDGTYDPASYVGAVCDYDKFAINGYKPYGCEFIIDNNDIASRLNGAYNISTIDLYLKISKTSYAPDSYTSEPLKFYVKLLLSNTGSVLGQDGTYWFSALHYTDYTIELDSKGISAYAWCFKDSGSVGDFKVKTSPSPFTILPGSGSVEKIIRLDNITFSTDWKNSIYDRYELRSNTIGFNENDYLHPDIFTNVKEAFKEGRVVAIQIYPDNAKGQCFKVEDCYIKLNYKK